MLLPAPASTPAAPLRMECARRYDALLRCPFALVCLRAGSADRSSLRHCLYPPGSESASRPLQSLVSPLSLSAAWLGAHNHSGRGWRRQSLGWHAPLAPALRATGREAHRRGEPLTPVATG